MTDAAVFPAGGTDVRRGTARGAARDGFGALAGVRVDGGPTADSHAQRHETDTAGGAANGIPYEGIRSAFMDILKTMPKPTVMGITADRH